MHQIRAIDLAGVDAGQYECRGNDPFPHLHAGAQPLGEGGLAGAELSGEDQQVAVAHQLAQGFTHGLGLGHRGELESFFAVTHR